MNAFVPPGLCGLGACALLWGSLHFRRKQRLLHDLPTSKVRGVFIGLVEVTGAAESASPLTAFLSARPCVHYHAEVQEHWSRTVTETVTGSDGKPQTRTRHESGWTTVAQHGETQDFFLRDETGSLLIRPAGATLEPVALFDETVSRGEPLYYGRGPATVVAHSDHRRRFVEHGIPVHTPLYVVGQARERADVVAAEIAADPAAPAFLISTRTEKSVQRGYAAWSWVTWTLGLAAATGAGLLHNSATASRTPDAPLATAALFLLFWIAGWTWMVFNSLVALRARVRQGWSLIDVQLKRRHDLLPGLIAAVTGLQSHERQVQVAVAQLRAQAQATPPGQTGPDYEGLAPILRATLEAYPDLLAHASFAQLHRELVDTEQRIALARSYYNDIATHFATRLERIPDGWVARLAAMRREPLLVATRFERAAVPATLDSAASP